MTPNYQEAKVQFHDYYSRNADYFRSAESFFRSLVESIIVDKKIPFHAVQSRVKSRESCLEKFDRRYRSQVEESSKPYAIRDHISDLIGLRVVCLYEDDVAQIADTLEETLTAVEPRKDRFAERDTTPTEFGYRAIHLSLALNPERQQLAEYRRFKDLRFEVQIRTIIQDAWSVLDHKLQYKGHAPPKLKRAINALAAVFERADQDFLSIRQQVNEAIATAKENVATFESHFPPKDSEAPSAPPASPVTARVALDAISANELLKQRFPEFFGSLAGVSRLLDECNVPGEPDLSMEELSNAINAHREVVNQYEKDAGIPLSPLTIVRHCLVLEGPARFKGLLFDYQRSNFEDWLKAREQQSAPSQ